MKRAFISLALAILLLAGMQSSASAAPLPAPRLSVDGMELDWNSVSGANGYNVYRVGANPEYQTTVRNATSFTATREGRWYVTAFNTDANPDVYSGRSNEVTVTRGGDPEPPVGSLPPPRLSVDGMELDWNSVSGANGYNVYRVGANPEYQTTVRNATSFTATREGRWYVTAFNTDANPDVYSGRSNEVTVTRGGDPEPPDDGTWRSEFRDDFDDGGFTDNWYQPWSTADYGNSRDGEFSTAQCSQRGNRLILEARTVNGEPHACYLASRSNLEFGPGDGTVKIEYRVNVSDLRTESAWFATWIYAFGSKSEIDVLEYIPYVNDDGTFNRNNWFHPAVHNPSEILKPDESGRVQNGYINADQYGINLLDDRFRTFSVEWDRNCQVFSIDDQVYWVNTRNVSNAEDHRLMLTIEVDNPDTPGGTNIWGRPTGNFQDNIRNSTARAEVDWVEVMVKDTIDPNLCR